MNILLLMMAGSGLRFGASIPKQFVEVNDKPIFSYILQGYDKCEDIDCIITVTHPDWLGHVSLWAEKMKMTKLRAVIKGGATRSESVRNGLIAAKEFASDDDVVLIHDATHPYVDGEGVKEIVEAVKEYGGATLGQRQYDTVYKMNSETKMLEEVIPRETVVSGASPEAFRFGDLYRIYTNSTEEQLAKMTSAGAMALHYGIPMKVVDANVVNLKITYKNDMAVFEKLVDLYFQEGK